MLVAETVPVFPKHLLEANGAHVDVVVDVVGCGCGCGCVDIIFHVDQKEPVAVVIVKVTGSEGVVGAVCAADHLYAIVPRIGHFLGKSR